MTGSNTSTDHITSITDTNNILSIPRTPTNAIPSSSTRSTTSRSVFNSGNNTRSNMSININDNNNDDEFKFWSIS